MKKLIYALCFVTLIYLGIQLVEFKLNEEYRNRYNDSEYLSGNKVVTCYNII